MQSVQKSVVLPGGLRLDYAEHGEADGLPVVFLHGYSDSWRSYERILPSLPHGFRALALTLRGHGDSGHPDAGYSMGDFAADLDLFMEELGIVDAVIVGHSMGASVAQRFAWEFPGRTRGLVLVGGNADWLQNAAVRELGEYVITVLADPVDPGFVSDFQCGTIGQPVEAGLLERVVAESLKMPARVWKAALVEGILKADHRRILGGIRAPTLLLCGDRDGLAREGQEFMADTIPGARLVTYPAAGHALHWEEPARFVRDLATFVFGEVTISRVRQEACHPWTEADVK